MCGASGSTYAGPCAESKMIPLVYYYPTGHEAHFEPGHPERPERVETIRRALQEAGWWDDYPRLEPLPIPQTLLHAVHNPAYLSMLEISCRRGGLLVADTYVTPASWQLALNAAGGAAGVAQAVWRGEAGSRGALRGFALCRPPGHHAMHGQGMGFCLINNIAVAAEHLIQNEGAQKLAIVDLDLHHGNGTQDIFYHRGDVLFISTHQMPLYPGTGYPEEVGSGSGEGATVNIPMPPFSGDRAFLAAMDELILPLLERFAPQMILVSYGFDTHWQDPLGYLMLSADGSARLISRLAGWADHHCQGRIALVLEGGYDLEAAAACSQAVVAALLGVPWDDPLGPATEVESSRWEGQLQKLKQFWKV